MLCLSLILLYNCLNLLRFTSGECIRYPKAKIPTYLEDYNFDNLWFRLGNTRFFIHTTNEGYKTDIEQWSESFATCRDLLHPEAKLPVLDKISSNAIVARHLERIVEKLNVSHYSYWIAAKSAGREQSYNWHTKGLGIHDGGKRLIEYSNIFYKAPRMIGLTFTDRGSVFINESQETGLEHEHESDPNYRDRTDRCILFALPFHNKPDLGWQASWREEVCNFEHPMMCEHPLPECDANNENINPHVLTEDKEYYYTEGNWIFSNRRFVVNWKPRNRKDAEKYCKKYKMQLFSPVPEDICLVPYLKLWGTVISTYHFWTTYKYKISEKSFYAADGTTLIQRGAKKAHHYVAGRFGGNRPRDRSFTYVSYIWSNERSNETRCKGINCNWMYYMLAPIDGLMPIGTICQHEAKDNTRACDFQNAWHSDFKLALVPTAVVEFGYRGSGFWRSTYKQTFGSRICGHPDRQMVGKDTDYWSVAQGDNVEFLYDYDETYWVVDEDWFQHVGKHEPLCSISQATNSGGTWTRTFSKVNCDEWHFYLCELAY